MTASERFRRFLAGESVDRSPAIEWAPWWHLTVERWRTEGLPESARSVEDIQEFFGLDNCFICVLIISYIINIITNKRKLKNTIYLNYFS